MCIRDRNRRVVLVIMGNTDTRYPAEPEQVTAAPTATVAENSGTTGKASAKIH